MLESASDRLCEKGGPHFGSPDKAPSRRLDTLRAAGELGIPMSSGLLIGIGETRRERIESLLALHHCGFCAFSKGRGATATIMYGHTEQPAHWAGT